MRPLPLTLALVAALPLAAQQPARAPLVWPAAPDTARIQYVGSFRSEKDLRRNESFLHRLGRWLTGGRGTALYELQRPFDLVAPDSTRTYLTNGSVRAVIVFDRVARRVRLFGSDVPGGLGKPMGLGLGPRGEIYVADASQRRVVVLDSTGHYLRAFGGSTVLLNPVDVAVDGEDAWVVDSYLHQVLRFDRSGQVTLRVGRQAGTLAERDQHRAAVPPLNAGDPHRTFTPDDLSDVWQNRGSGAGEFRYPASVAVGPDGTLYVSDQLNFRVQAFARDGRFLRSVGKLGDQPGTFTRPKGVAVDRDNHLYVVDAAFNNVQIFDDQGRLLLAFGQLGYGAGEHWLPLGITIDRSDRIYVADRYNNRVAVYQYLGQPGGLHEPRPAPGGR